MLVIFSIPPKKSLEDCIIGNKSAIQQQFILLLWSLKIRLIAKIWSVLITNTLNAFFPETLQKPADWVNVYLKILQVNGDVSSPRLDCKSCFSEFTQKGTEK